MICGTYGTYTEHLRYVRDVIGLRPGVKTLAAMNMLMLPDRQIFICDTYVNQDPTAEQIAEMTLLGGRGGAPLRPGPECRAHLPLELRQLRLTVGAEDARGPRPGRGRRARPRRGRRDAGRRRALEADPGQRVPRLAPQDRGQSAHHAERRRGQHRLQHPQGGRWRRHHRRPDPAGRGAAGAHPDADRERPPDREHDGAGGGRRRMGANGRWAVRS